MKNVMLFLVLFGGSIVWADDSRTPQAVNDRDEEVATRAKRRAYPGGADEGELKVQDPLPVPTRKVSPIFEDQQSESHSDE